MGEGVWIVDFEENIFFANEKFAEIFWVNIHELLKMNIKTFIDPTGLTYLESETEQRKEGKESIYELTIIRPDGERRLIQVKATPYRDTRGEIIGTMWVFEDITEKKRLEQIRRVAAKITEETLKTKDQEALFWKIHENIQTLLPNGKATNFYICLIEKEGENDISEDTVIYPYYSDEIDEPPTGSEKLGNNMTSSVIKTGKLIHIPFEETEIFYKDLWITCTGTEPEDWLGVPLCSDDGKVIWAMVVQIYEPKGLHYTTYDEDIISDIASQVALAIQKKRSMDIIEREKIRYKALTEGLSEWVGIMDAKENFLLENPALKKIFWIPLENTLLGRNLLDFVHPDDKKLVRENTRAREKWESSSYEIRITRSDGELRFIQINASPEGQGSEFQILAIIRDVTDQKAREDQLIQDALHDPLTWLGSFRALKERLNQEFYKYLRINQNGAHQKLTVAFADVDGLKAVNDTFGHDAGSELICEVAKILSSVVRPNSDCTYRHSGDEFISLFPECSLENAKTILGPRIQEKINARNENRRKEYEEKYLSGNWTEKIPPYYDYIISVSVGFAEFDPQIHKLPEDLKNEADQDMYIDKYTKKARRCFEKRNYEDAYAFFLGAYEKNSIHPKVLKLLATWESFDFDQVVAKDLSISSEEKIKSLKEWKNLKSWLDWDILEKPTWMNYIISSLKSFVNILIDWVSFKK